MATIELPYPPSVNHYYRCYNNRIVIDTPGRVYRATVCSLVGELGHKTLDGPLAVEVLVYPPDNRRRDLDNILKCLLDSLQHAGIYGDDSQVERLELVKMDPVADGKVEVSIRRRRRS